MARLYRAPAKINLTLEVLARRDDDGYHTMRSVMVPLELADEIVIEPSRRFGFACDTPELGGDDNLVVAAARALGTPAARVELRKRIPTQAGLGGGSSDAAAVLRAAMDGTFGPPPALDWMATARGLGSDVPFFLAGTGALVEGTGERVTPAGALPAWHVLIVKPPAAISTAAAYAELDRFERPSRPRNGSVSIAVLTALQRGDFSGVLAGLSNDFQEIAVVMAPEIGEALEALRRAGASNALLAGSGSCVFTLAPDRETIDRVAQRLELASSHARFVTAFAATPDWRA